MMTFTMNPALEGYNAFQIGIPFEQNPYSYGADADAWERGWLEAEDDNADDNQTTHDLN